jgi:hypothetical protein
MKKNIPILMMMGIKRLYSNERRGKEEKIKKEEGTRRYLQIK